MNDSANATHDNRRLLAWTALVAASALLIIGVKATYDVPDDVRYRYSTVLFAVVVAALQLAIVLKIAGRVDLRETFALRRPSWSLRRVALVGALIVIGTYLVLAFLPFLQQSEAEGVGAPFDPGRALPFVLNAIVLVIVSPILEELMFRGLGFKLLERYGHATAIVLTGLAFGLVHPWSRIHGGCSAVDGLDSLAIPASIPAAGATPPSAGTLRFPWVYAECAAYLSATASQSPGTTRRARQKASGGRATLTGQLGLRPGFRLLCLRANLMFRRRHGRRTCRNLSRAHERVR